MALASFEHNGIKIELSTSGMFFAVVSGRKVHKPSLDAMKKFLDESKKTAFEPFTALVHESRLHIGRVKKSSIKRIKIIGIDVDNRRSHRDAFRWLCDDGSNRLQVYADTKDNEAAIEAYSAAVAKNRKIKEQLDEQENALEEKIVVLIPLNYKEKKQ